MKLTLIDININMEDLAEYIPMQTNRCKIYEKFYKLLNSNTEQTTSPNINLQKIALNIERGIYNEVLNNIDHKEWNDMFKFKYINKAITVYINLDPDNRLNNRNYIKRLLNKEFSEFELAQHTPAERFPEKWEIISSKCNDNDIITPKMEASTGLFKCGKCKTYNTMHWEIFSRSADEPAMVHVECIDCGKRWKFC